MRVEVRVRECRFVVVEEVRLLRIRLRLRCLRLRLPQLFGVLRGLHDV